MEPLAFHPNEKFFIMAGHSFKGDWNAALSIHEIRLKFHHQYGFRIFTSTFPAGKTLSPPG